MKEPMNDLERAFAAAARGLEGRPEFFRQLRDSQLWFLTPGQPNGQTLLKGEKGSGLTFAVWVRKKKACIPIFTSSEQAEQALKAAARPGHRQNVLQMKGGELFHAIAARQPPCSVVINPACGTGEMLLDATAVRLLADGSILTPLRPEKREEGMVRIVEPADYPTQLLEPLFQYLHRCAVVRAAWLFRHQPASPSAEPTYIVGLLMTDEDRARRIEQDLMVVAKGIRPVVKCSATVLNLSDPATAALTGKFPPFYTGPDYRPPAPPSAKTALMERFRQFWQRLIGISKQPK